MRYKNLKILPVLLIALMSLSSSTISAQDERNFELELEAGPVWQSSNDVQVPNTASGTKFSLAELVGNGPLPAGRLYFTWNISERHSLRLLLAPLAYTKPGTFTTPVNFAGQTYMAGVPLDATYKFNSWRLGYRYRFLNKERLKLTVGFTAKVRDAKIELAQGSTTSKDTDVGFVPLLHLGADWNFTKAWHLIFDFQGLAGGPGRAFDVALKVNYDIGEQWALSAGYRTIEGGADVEQVYNFAWFQYAVVSGIFRF